MYTQKLKQQISQQLQDRQYETHPLESQPLTHFFHALWEGTGHWCMAHRVSRPELDGKQCRLRQVADTVVWENNIPKGWYRYEEEYETVVAADGTKERQLKGNIKRDKVDTQKIDAAFTSGKSDTDIVGTYMTRGCNRESGTIKIMYLTKASLRSFLFARNRGKGSCMIQQWVQPQNGMHNDVIQAVWTRGVKCMVERRRNRHHLTDESVPLDKRIMTFDGAPHLSREINLSQMLMDKVNQACKSIADHFALNSQAQKGTKHQIARMVVQFKINRHNKLVLLGMMGVRVFAVGRRCDLLVALDLAQRYQHLPQAEEDNPPVRTSVIQPGSVRKKNPTRRLPAGAAVAAQGNSQNQNAIQKVFTCTRIASELKASATTARHQAVPPHRSSTTRWDLLRSAVTTGYLSASASAKTVMHDIEDACYMMTSHHLSRSRRPLTFTLCPFSKHMKPVAEAFLSSLGVELDARYMSEVTTYTTPAGATFPLHTSEVELQAAEARIAEILHRMEAACQSDPVPATDPNCGEGLLRLLDMGRAAEEEEEEEGEEEEEEEGEDEEKGGDAEGSSVPSQSCGESVGMSTGGSSAQGGGGAGSGQRLAAGGLVGGTEGRVVSVAELLEGSESMSSSSYNDSGSCSGPPSSGGGGGGGAAVGQAGVGDVGRGGRAALDSDTESSATPSSYCDSPNSAA